MFSVDERKLSPEAQKLLSNQKNKAAFVRNAIEFFVRKETSNYDYIENLLTEISDKLDMLIKSSSSNSSNSAPPDSNSSNSSQTFKGIQERLSRFIK